MTDGPSAASIDVNVDSSDDGNTSLAVKPTTAQEPSMSMEPEQQAPAGAPSPTATIAHSTNQPLPAQDLEQMPPLDKTDESSHGPLSLPEPTASPVEINESQVERKEDVESATGEGIVTADNGHATPSKSFPETSSLGYVERSATLENSYMQEVDKPQSLEHEEDASNTDAPKLVPMSDANSEWMDSGEPQLDMEEPATILDVPPTESSLDTFEEPIPTTPNVESHHLTESMPSKKSSSSVASQVFESMESENETNILEELAAAQIDSSPQRLALQSSTMVNSTPFTEPEGLPSSDGLFWAEENNESMPWEVEDQFSRDLTSEKSERDNWNQEAESSGIVFSENITASSIGWAEETWLSTTDNPAQDSPTDGNNTFRDELLDTSGHDGSRQELDIEDSWSKAFGSPESGLDESWNAAFGDGFEDEDGLLQEPAVTPSPLPQAQAATTSPIVAPSQVPSMNVRTTSAYSAAPVAPPITGRQSPSTPMQFFEELPSAPLRARKPRQQTASQPQPSAPPQAIQSKQVVSEHKPSSAVQFRAPDRMDPFPPQPSVPVASPAAPYSAGAPHQQPLPRPTSSYSPAPHIPPSFAVPQTTQHQLAISSKYASAQPQAPEGFAAHPQPQPSSRSPYAPASMVPAAPLVLTGSNGSSFFTNSLPPLSAVAEFSRPGAPAAPTQGVSATNRGVRNPPISSVYSAATSPQANALVETASQYSSNQTTHAPSPPAPPPANRFAPRTSSPLAQQGYRPIADSSSSGPRYQDQTGHRISGRGDFQGQSQNSQFLPQEPNPSGLVAPQDPTVAFNAERGMLDSPPLQNQSQQEMFASIPTPRRPATSSPKATLRRAPIRALSVEQSGSMQAAESSPGIFSNGGQLPHSLPSGHSENVEFLLPADETASDPLQRWKGAPIFHWGAGGLVVTSLPSHVPRYGGGQTAPKFKPLSGDFKLQKAKELLSYREQLPAFPGPLKSKGKKKDVINWLAAVIDIYEKQIQTIPSHFTAHWTKLEEKTALWRVVKVLVEFDGVLTGSLAVEGAARDALKSNSPDSQHSANPVVHPVGSTPPSKPDGPAAVNNIKRYLLEGNREKAIWYAVDNQLWAHAMALSPASGPAIWKQVVQEFVKKEVRSLEHDNQSMAALYQVLAGNWDESIDELVPLSARSGFQMISTASTPAQARDAFEGLNKWRETLSLILSNKTSNDENAILSLGKLLCGSGRIEAAHVCYLFAKSLAQFGGADDPQTVLTLLGVDLNNPWSTGGVDVEAIQLSEVYEFALSLAPTNSSSYAPHLQAYKLQHALSLAESGQRTEALQYCDSITAAIKSTTRVSPYYNNTLISQLDDLQLRLSQAPKDGSSSWISRPSIGKVSSSMGTWFSSFVAGDENDAASTGSGHLSEGENGPFARIVGGTPIVSRSASSVDLHANYSAVHPPSSGGSRYAPAAYAPRSMPGEDLGPQGSFVPYSSSPEHRHATYSPRQSAGSPAHSYGSQQVVPQFARQSSHLSQHQLYSPQSRPDSASSTGPRPLASYEPYVPTVREEASPSPYSNNYNGNQRESQGQSSGFSESQADQKTNGYNLTSNGYSPNGEGYEPPSAVKDDQSGGYEPPNAQNELSQSEYAPLGSSYEPSQGGYEPPTGSYDEPPTGSYEPPTGSYEPLSYQPYQPSEPEVEADTSNAPPPNRSSMDDNNEVLDSRAGESKKQEKAQNDKAADDAFRAAAEADAARDKPKDKRATSGWFGGIGGLFGGKKDPTMPTVQKPTVHKAKLGEESSFYFDNETKKWVNRKGGASPAPSATSSTAPPPPRSSAPPSRNVSGVPAPPPPTSSPALTPASGEASLKPGPSTFATPGTPSRSDTPASNADSMTNDAPRSPEGGDLSPLYGSGSGPPSAPPSRPPTSMNTVTSIDDLLGAPQARKGGTVKKGKKGQRYVDIMAK